ncbi:MAG TPA: hypothetical protein VL175_16740 [Pirellulales bacterium]|nr:hypothetical protein [Pirellulales bacterium]
MRCFLGVVCHAIFFAFAQEPAAEPHAFAVPFLAMKSGNRGLDLFALFDGKWHLR